MPFFTASLWFSLLPAKSPLLPRWDSFISTVCALPYSDLPKDLDTQTVLHSAGPGSLTFTVVMFFALRLPAAHCWHTVLPRNVSASSPVSGWERCQKQIPILPEHNFSLRGEQFQMVTDLPEDKQSRRVGDLRIHHLVTQASRKEQSSLSCANRGRELLLEQLRDSSKNFSVGGTWWESRGREWIGRASGLCTHWISV